MREGGERSGKGPARQGGTCQAKSKMGGQSAAAQARPEEIHRRPDAPNNAQRHWQHQQQAAAAAGARLVQPKHVGEGPGGGVGADLGRILIQHIRVGLQRHPLLAHAGAGWAGLGGWRAGADDDLRAGGRRRRRTAERRAHGVLIEIACSICRRSQAGPGSWLRAAESETGRLPSVGSHL